MKKLLTFALVIVIFHAASADELKKTDDAEIWLRAPAQEQAAVVTALAGEVGISRRSELRYLILCMRDVAANFPDAKRLTVNDLFNGCLQKPDK